MDPYKVLELERDAGDLEIKSHYRSKCGQHHPDKGGTHSKMAEINEAYEILSDPARRARYDRTGDIKAEINFEDIARQRILQEFIKAANNNSWQQGNYIQSLRNAFNDGKGQITQKREKLERVRLRMDEMVPKHPDAENNIFAAAVRGQQAKIDTDLDNIAKELKLIDIVIALLEPYADNIPPHQFASSMFYNSTPTGGF